jgi:hypothetical protein
MTRGLISNPSRGLKGDEGWRFNTSYFVNWSWYAAKLINVSAQTDSVRCTIVDRISECRIHQPQPCRAKREVASTPAPLHLFPLFILRLSARCVASRQHDCRCRGRLLHANHHHRTKMLPLAHDVYQINHQEHPILC